MLHTRSSTSTLIILTLLTCSLAACKAKELPDEPYTPVSYNLYPAPQDAYVGDTMPFVTDDGTLELYYLYDTDHNGQGYHPIYKYSTKDLCSYEDHGKVLDFGQLSDPDPAIGTGSVMQDQDGLYHLFYTGHNDTGNGGKGKECVMHATSTDRENWVKIPEDTFYSPDNYSKDDFRDPEVFWVDEEQCYWLLIAARENIEGGVVTKYTSTDLKNWEFQGPIFAPHAQYMLECPDLFRMGDKWYLTYSWDCVTYYAMSDSMYGPNHQLLQRPDGTLGVREPETFAGYFTSEKPFQAVQKEGKAKIKNNTISLTASEGGFSLADMGTRAPTMMLECDVTLDQDGRAGFAFGGSQEDPTYTVLCLDAGRGCVHYEGYEIADLSKYEPVAYTRFDFTQQDVHHVKLVCENEIVILYIDDTKALQNHAFCGRGTYRSLFRWLQRRVQQSDNQTAGITAISGLHLFIKLGSGSITVLLRSARHFRNGVRPRLQLCNEIVMGSDPRYTGNKV